MKTPLAELIEKWESEIGSYIPNAPIYKAFIEEAKTFLEKEKASNEKDMKFSEKELETIKDALSVALGRPEEIEDEAAVIRILDRIDDEAGLD